ncbi:hypothetical protein D3C87_475810 [compost metagenome]
MKFEQLADRCVGSGDRRKAKRAANHMRKSLQSDRKHCGSKLHITKSTHRYIMRHYVRQAML